PSGVALATWSFPRIPLAPGLFSTTTGTPNRSPRCLPTSRAMVSVPPPAGYGTMRLMGLAGYGSAAPGAAAARPMAQLNQAAPHARAHDVRRAAFMLMAPFALRPAGRRLLM